jgi:hypothetical protein
VIVRAALAFGLAWLLVPHHPDLDLMAPLAQSGDTARVAIIARLREVRSDIEAQIMGHGNLVWDESWGVALQNAGRPPEAAALAPILKKALRTALDQGS